MSKIMIGMSGGVDSSVAALLLREQNEICGVTLKLTSHNDTQDFEDANAISKRLGICHFVFDFTEAFHEKVICAFKNDYAHGLTPNPCVICNRHIKFQKLIEKADELGYEFVASGHYAQIDCINGRYVLKTAVDDSKDQTYFLYALTQDLLKRIKFPLGKLTKQKVREIANENGLITAHKRDSQDICFIKHGDYKKFLHDEMKINSPAGNFIDKTGNVLGKHTGLCDYTIGQRKGFNISFGGRKYVIQKNVIDNTIMLGDESDLLCDNFIVHNVNLIAVDKLIEPMNVTVKVRYNQQATAAIISPHKNNSVYVKLLTPQKSVTPGQAAVFYLNEIVLGGGIISFDKLNLQFAI